MGARGGRGTSEKAGAAMTASLTVASGKNAICIPVAG